MALDALFAGVMFYLFFCCATYFGPTITVCTILILIILVVTAKTAVEYKDVDNRYLATECINGAIGQEYLGSFIDQGGVVDWLGVSKLLVGSKVLKEGITYCCFKITPSKSNVGALRVGTSLGGISYWKTYRCIEICGPMYIGLVFKNEKELIICIDKTPSGFDAENRTVTMHKIDLKGNKIYPAIVSTEDFNIKALYRWPGAIRRELLAVLLCYRRRESVFADFPRELIVQISRFIDPQTLIEKPPLFPF
jgi:hypothetical protein